MSNRKEDFYRSPLGGRIPLLTNKNWTQWASDFKRLLMAKRAWPYVDGVKQHRPTDLAVVNDVQPDPADIAARLIAQEDWDSNNQEILYMIHCGCGEEAKAHIEDIETVKDAWMALRSRYDKSTTPAGRHTILTEFMAMRMSVGESIAEYCSRLEHGRSKLKGTDNAISEATLRHQLLHTLTPEFGPLSIMLSTQDQSTLTLATVKSQLESAEGSINLRAAMLAGSTKNNNQQSQSGPRQIAAHAASRSHQQGQQRNKGKRQDYSKPATRVPRTVEYTEGVGCVFHKRNDHSTEDCNVLKRAAAEMDSDDDEDKGCTACGELSHTAGSCPARIKGELRRAKNMLKSQKRNAKKPRLNLAAAQDSDQEGGLEYDSGPSDESCPDGL